MIGDGAALGVATAI